MNRALALLNLLGVLVLTGLCVLQWRANRTLNHDVNRFEQSKLSQAALLAEQASQIAGLTADLDRFRAQLAATTLSQKEDAEKQLCLQRDQLAASSAEWTAAVAARDKRITEDNDRIRELSTQLNDTVAKYNVLVRQVNEERAADAGKPASP
jgi:TPP-dependent trihydroxycyclohexane-1,2-dione (THcHDO) dehydratase